MTLYLDTKKEWSTHTCYNMGELQKHYAMWKKSDTKALYRMIPFTGNVHNRHIHGDRKQISSCLRLRGEGNGDGWLLMGTGFLLQVTKMSWDDTAVIAAQPGEYTKNHWNTHFRMANFMAYELYLKNKKQKDNWVGIPWFLSVNKSPPAHAGGFPGGSVIKHLPANAGDMGLTPVSGRSPGGRNGNPLQYSCLGNPMDIGAWQGIWQATVHTGAKSQTWMSN